MKAIKSVAAGGPEVLTLSEWDRPIPHVGEVLIEVRFAGVNRPDIAQRQGRYPPPPGASPLLGLEVSGVIHTLGPGTSDLGIKVGDRVCALVPGGGYAEYCVAPARHCLPVPDGVSDEEAAGIPENYFTVWTNVFQRGGLKAGERFLVHGGTSGIGNAAIQLAHSRGATVFTTAGSDEKCALCISIGASTAVNYRREDFSKSIRDIDVILDMVGGSYTRKNIECLRDQGRLVQIAALEGSEVTLDVFKIMQKRILFTGSTLRPRTIEEKAAIAQDLRTEVWPLFASREIKVLVDEVFPLSDAASAHRRMESSAHMGKILLKI